MKSVDDWLKVLTFCDKVYRICLYSTIKDWLNCQDMDIKNEGKIPFLACWHITWKVEPLIWNMYFVKLKSFSSTLIPFMHTLAVKKKHVVLKKLTFTLAYDIIYQHTIYTTTSCSKAKTTKETFFSHGRNTLKHVLLRKCLKNITK